MLSTTNTAEGLAYARLDLSMTFTQFPPRKAPSDPARVPPSLYAGLYIAEFIPPHTSFCLCLHDSSFSLGCHAGVIDSGKISWHGNDKDEHPVDCQELFNSADIETAIINTIIAIIRDYSDRYEYKVQAIGLGFEEFDLVPKETKNKIAEAIWLQLDAVPFILRVKDGPSMYESAHSLVRKTVARINAQAPGAVVELSFGKDHEVNVDYSGEMVIGTAESYQDVTSKTIFEEFLALRDWAVERKLKVTFFNSTPRGGGGYVPKPNPEVFKITKSKFHNVLQGVSNEDLTDKEKRMWEKWVEKNFKRYWQNDNGPIKTSDVLVCAGIPIVAKLNPRALIVYRSHIQLDSALIDDESTAQHRTWNYLNENFIKHAKVFVPHPVPSFIPWSVPKDSVVLVPASTDPLDGLNKPMMPQDKTYWRKVFHRLCIDQGVSGHLKEDREYVIQVARFDPSKGIPDVIESYKKFRHNFNQSNSETAGTALPEFLSLPPQLVICGHGSIDDPEGNIFYEGLIRMIDDDPDLRDFTEDICIVRLPPCDQILNVLLRGAWLALQLSHREGFEVKVTEAIDKGVPVIAYNAGGIPFQIENEKTGILVEVGDVSSVAEWMLKLWWDRNLWSQLSVNAKSNIHKQEYFVVKNAINWLTIAKECIKTEADTQNSK